MKTSVWFGAFFLGVQSAIAQSLPVSLTPSPIGDEVEVTIDEATPVQILPEHTVVMNAIRKSVYGNAAWPSSTGIWLQPLSTPSSYQVAVLNLENGSIVDQSATLDISLELDLPQHNADLLDMVSSSSMSVTQASTAGVISRNGLSVNVFGALTTMTVSSEPSAGVYLLFLPEGKTATSTDAQVAAVARADLKESRAAGMVPASPGRNLPPLTAEQKMCAEECERIYQRDRQRAFEDRETAHGHCFRNWGWNLLFCLPAWAYPPTGAVCSIGVSVNGIVCEHNAEIDLKIKLRRIEEDWRQCMRDCGIIVAEN